MYRQFFLLLIAASANATSVFPEFHECPVCGVRSVTMSLASDSQFGEPSRDLSDSSQFRFTAVEVCPGDLYASWADAWQPVDDNEKSKLTKFLKEPFLQLTVAEKSIIGNHEMEFRESCWFQPLWARTCDGFRSNDDRRKLKSILRLHFAGRHLDSQNAGQDWEKQLASLFRENAIAALKDVATAKWPTETEKRVFAYLRAELTRKAGRNEEAFSLFQDVIASEKTAKPNEELVWISRWASEQSLHSSPETRDPGKPNETRVTNQLRRAAGRADDRMIWRKNVLLPMIRKSAVEGDIPEPDIPKNDPVLRLPSLEEGTSANVKPKPPFDDLCRELYPLWEEVPSARPDIAHVYIRILRQAAENRESTGYPAMYLLPAIAATEEGRAAIRKELAGPWKSSFWKAACEYAARLPNSVDAFTGHPFAAQADDGLIFKMLSQRSDASWRDDSIQKLKGEDWVSSELIDYLISLNQPETRSALDTFATQIRNQTGNPDGKLSALRRIEDSRVKALFRAVPIR